MTNQTILRIVVEWEADALLLRSILGEELKGRVRFSFTDGRGSPLRVGRNLLVIEGGPVLLVMNSDTLNPRKAKEDQGLTAYALTSVAPGELGRVFVFMSEIEVVFFEAPQALERLLGKPVPPEVVREGLLIPKQTLERLLEEGTPKRDYLSFVRGIDPQSAADLARGKQAVALKNVVGAMLTPAVEAV